MTHDSTNTRKSETEADLFDQILELDAASADRPKRLTNNKWPVRILVVSLAILVPLTIWNVIQLTRVPVSISNIIEEESTRFSIYLAAQAIEEYRDSTGALPPSLEMLGAEEEEIIYEPADTTYVLSASVGKLNLVYHMGDDLTSYREAYDIMQSPETP